VTRRAIAIAALMLAAAGTLPAQTQGSAPATPAQQPAAPSQPSQAPPAPAPQSATPAPSPPPPHQPEAKSQAEYDAYLKASGEKDLGKAESAAKDFEAKFPASELRGVLYLNLMNAYQQANNAPKTIEMGRKVLQFFPDNSVALVTTANVLAETTHDTDADRDQRFAEAERDARHAIESIDTGLGAPANWSKEQVESARNLVLSMAHAAIGFLELRKNNDALAEQELRLAAQLNQAQPYGPTWYRLALALDHQHKFAEALAAVNKSLPMFAADDPMLELAKREQDRLNKLTGAAPPPPDSTTPPPKL
jgi:tetratricopeptide (TPR) repeat protein